jgi:hypothetical protein
MYQLGKLDHALGLGDMLHYFAEIDGRSPLVEMLERAVANIPEFKTKHFDSVFDLRLYRIVLYVLVRALRPACIVETGVHHGLTTVFLLEALRLNGSGALKSIDLPSFPELGPAGEDGCEAILPRGLGPGWIVPEELADHWELHIGNSLELLPRVFANNMEVDLFIHDSDHTNRVMWPELNIAWEHLRPGGVLVCDNIAMCTSFFDFCQKVSRVPYVVPYCTPNATPHVRFGIICK